MIVVVMGVSGCGKTEIGRRLDEVLACPFLDGDSLHPPANIAKMRSAVALTDDDRAPWLEAVAGRIGAAGSAGKDLVVACSALKSAYRAALMAGAVGNVRFTWLDAPLDVLRRRLEARRGHFMPATLLESQLATLEPPVEAEALRVDATLAAADVVRFIASALGRAH